MSGLADELLKLRFVPRPLQSLYLNHDRVSERFTSHLGAIGEWTRRSESEGGVGIDIKVVKADARAGGGNEVSYDLHDVTVRALLLQDALQAAEALRLALAGPASSNDRMWLLTLGPDVDVTAAVLNSLWINDAVISYIHADWAMFGTLRERIEGVPTLAAIHVWVKMPETVMGTSGYG